MTRALGSSCTRVAEFTRRRVELGLSARAVAAHLTELGHPTTESSILGWEAGQYLPAVPRLSALSQILHVPEADVEDWFYGDFFRRDP